MLICLQVLRLRLHSLLVHRLLLYVRWPLHIRSRLTSMEHTERSFGAVAGRTPPRLDRLGQYEPKLQVLYLSVTRVSPLHFVISVGNRVEKDQRRQEVSRIV